MNYIQRIDTISGGQVAQNVNGDMVAGDKIVNIYYHGKNEIEIIIDTEIIKENGTDNFISFDDDLPFGNEPTEPTKKYYIEQFLHEIINIKSNITNPSINIQTHLYLELKNKLSQTNDLYLKLKLSQEIEIEKIKSKEFKIFIDLIFDNIIELDFSIIEYTLYYLATTEDAYAWGEEQIIYKFYCDLMIYGRCPDEVDEYTKNFVRDKIANFFEDSISENIWIPSTVKFYNRNFTDCGAVIKYSWNRKTGFLNEKEKSNIHLKSKFYSEIIKCLVSSDVDYSSKYFYIGNYTAELDFTNAEKGIRENLSRFIFDEQGKILKRFEKIFKFDSWTQNPIFSSFRKSSCS